jgi:hypothetical protein
MKPRTSIILLVLSSIVSFASAFIGFGGAGEDFSITTRVYLALQLFTFEGGDISGPVPLGVEIARWLAPATTLGGIYAAAHTFFTKLWGSIRLRWIRGHTVICGGGEKGCALASELAQESSEQVVLIDPLELPAIEALRKQGVLVIQGDASDSGVLKEAGLARASRLVCITGDDRTNIGVTLTAADSLPEERELQPLVIHTHVNNVATRNILQRSQMMDLRNDNRHRIRLFSCHANRARLALEECPLEWDSRTGLRDQEVHLVVGILGPLEKAMVVQAAHIGHFRNGAKIRVHLISTRAKSDEAALLKEYPGFRNSAHLDFSILDESDDFVETVAKAASCWDCNSLITILLSGTPEAALADALLLGERLKDGPCLRVLIDTKGNSGIRSIVAKNPKLISWIRFLPELSAAVSRNAVFQSSLDVVARRIHETWKQGTDHRIHKAELEGDFETAKKHREKDTYHAWEDLTEEQKDVNRLAADHITIKFRAVGLDPDLGPSLSNLWENLDTQKIDMLSRMEHERWAAPLWMAGWTAGKRNDELKIHPNLVPYEELDEGTQKYDIEQVKMAAAYFSIIDK